MMWKLQPPSETLKPHHPIFNFCSGERRSSDCGATAQTYASSRWCPTPEQLRALEEFYKRGIRTPSTYQIQQITAQLRRFGRIEGKNVFYWFQNHKARERQRIRRRLSSGMQDHVLRSFEGKPPKDVENMKNKNWASNATLQEGVSIARTDTAGGEKDGWIVQQLLVDREIKQIHNNNHNGISPSRQSHVNIHPHSSISSNEDHYSCIDWQFELPKISTRRPEKTLELFPIHCDEKANEDPVQFYEFL